MTKQEKYLIETVSNRINELTKNAEVQKYLNSFDNDDEAKAWLTKIAISTLIGKN